MRLYEFANPHRDRVTLEMRQLRQSAEPLLQNTAALGAASVLRAKAAGNPDNEIRNQLSKDGKRLFAFNGNGIGSSPSIACRHAD